MSKAMDWVTRLATCYPLGQMPKAPGTWGSLPGLVLGPLIYSASQTQAVVDPWLFAPLCLLCFSLLSWKIIDHTEKLWGTHDDKSIVIDEVAGQAIPLAFFPWDPLMLGIAFALFRLFDISKPLAIGWADRKVHGSLGTLLDDLLAGLVVLVFFVLDQNFSQWIF